MHTWLESGTAAARHVLRNAFVERGQMHALPQVPLSAAEQLTELAEGPLSCFCQ